MSAIKKSPRIPDPIDQGRTFESSVEYLYHNYAEYKRQVAEGIPLDTVTADAYACGFPLPYFQRDLCWTREQEIAFIESVWLNLPLGTYTRNDLDWEGSSPKPCSGWLIDGQQRLTTLQRYWDDEFAVYGLLWSELTNKEKVRFKRVTFTHYVTNLDDENLLHGLYDRLALGGTPHVQSKR